MKYITIALVCLILLLVGCATTSTMTNPDLVMEKYPGRTLSMLPLGYATLTSEYPECIDVDDLQENLSVETYLTNFFQERFIHDIDTYVRNIDVDHIPVGTSFPDLETPTGWFQVEFPVEVTSWDGFNQVSETSVLRFSVPSQAALDNASFTPDILLIISKIKFSKDYSQYSSGAMGGGTSSVKNLKCEIEYLIYDYQNMDALSWGIHSVTQDVHGKYIKPDQLRNLSINTIAYPLKQVHMFDPMYTILRREF